MSKLLLFDIDGTLLSTRGAGIRALGRAGQRVLGDAYTLEGVSFAGCLDPLIFADGAQRMGLTPTESHIAAFIAAFAEELPVELASPETDVVIMPGFPDLLHELRKLEAITLGLLTGNLSVTGPIKLRHVGIDPDWFPVMAWGDDGPTRPSLVPVAMERYTALHGRRPDPQHVAVIGDTPNDVICAKENGCFALAVGTGKFTADELRAAGADIAVDDLSDARVLLEWIEA